MTIVHLVSVTITLLLYVLLGIAYFGWGEVVVLTLGRTRRVLEETTVSLSIFIGWAFTLLVFQLIHLILPLTIYTVSPVFATGLALAGISFAKSRRIRAEHLFALPSAAKLSFIFAMLLVSAWLASRSMLPPTHYDSGLYHLTTIRWINSFPIVPGLGNLHGRLAFNQSFFTYVAALNLHPFFGHGRSVANSFLLLLSILTLIELLVPIIRRPRLMTQLHPMQWVPAVFGLPVLAYWALSSNGLASPSPDLTSSLLQLIIFVIFARSLCTFEQKGAVSTYEIIVLSFLTATAITVKLSNVAFCGVILILLLISLLRKSEVDSRKVVCLLAPAVLIVLIWCIRGIILSGAPLYPSTIGYIHAKWSVPVAEIIDTKNWVYSWARQPNTHWRNVLGNWNWLAPWFDRVTREHFIDIVYPIRVFIILSVLSILAAILRKSRSEKYSFTNELLLLPIFAGLVLWFATAPDPRFSNALFLLLPIAVASLFAIHIKERFRGRMFLMIILICFIATNFTLLNWVYQNRLTLQDISLDGWQDVKQVPLKERITRTGLLVYTPVEGDQCWDAPLPCTPYFNENLQLIRHPNLASGFMVVNSGASK